MSVYGVSSDGYQFVFVAITHDGGTVKISRVSDVLQGDMAKVLGWLEHVLETTAAMSPNVTENNNNLEDPLIDVDNNDYIHPPEDDEEMQG